jgi:hypothetical protein
MAAEGSHEPARDPEDLERLLVSRQRAGDVDGKVALYEPNGVVDLGGGRLTLGRQSERSTRDWWQRVEICFWRSTPMHCRGRPGTHINSPSGWQRDR